MGRSVMTLSDATATAYQTFGPDEDYYRLGFNEAIAEGYADADDDFEDWLYGPYGAWDSQEDWDWLVEDIQRTLTTLFPSFHTEDNKWIDRELRVLVENEHSLVTISEYGGLVAICLGPNYDRSQYWAAPNERLSPLGEKWRASIEEKFLTTFGEYEKIGTFSNGESVYYRKAGR